MIDIPERTVTNHVFNEEMLNASEQVITDKGQRIDRCMWLHPGLTIGNPQSVEIKQNANTPDNRSVHSSFWPT